MKKENLATVILFLAFLLGLSGLFWTVKDRDFSENENRYLASAPKVSAESVLSGKFADEAEKYVSDQFVLRDNFMEAASSIRRFLGMKDINGVYIGEDGYLISKTEERDVDYGLFEKNIEYVNDFFRETDVPGRKVMMIVPTSAYILSDKLPDGAPEFDQKKALKMVSDGICEGDVTDVSETLAEDERQTYYRTDHHWTTYGAYDGYEAYCGLYGRKAVCYDGKWEAVSSHFRGSLYSKVLFSDCAYDDVTAVPEPSCSVVCDGEDGKLYHYEALEEKDKYKFFLGGNYGKVEIRGNGTGNLLIIKDSFANCFVPFLVNDYENITMIDLRYFMGSVGNIVQCGDITDVLVIYNISNFCSDENIIKLGL